jgi:formylglycine-generating enzyme required for sulfatase activity
MSKRISRNQVPFALALTAVLAVGGGLSFVLAWFEFPYSAPELSYWNGLWFLPTCASVCYLVQHLTRSPSVREPIWKGLLILPSVALLAIVILQLWVDAESLRAPLVVLLALGIACILQTFWVRIHFGRAMLRTALALFMTLAAAAFGFSLPMIAMTLRKNLQSERNSMDRERSRPGTRALFEIQPAVAIKGAHDCLVLEQDPNPAVIKDSTVRDRIRATGRPWKIRHVKSGVILLLVPSGEFQMGSPPTEHGRNDDEQMHRRLIRRAFYLAECELTWMQAQRLVDGGDIVAGTMNEQVVPLEGREDIPVFDAWLRYAEVSHRFFRLPSEAEWEHACRAGTRTAFWWGDMPEEASTVAAWEQRWTRAWGGSDWEDRCAGISEALQPACELPANPWGFRGMHGSVAEQCADDYTVYPATGDERAASALDPSREVLRGGSVFCRPVDRRSATRGNGQGFPAKGYRFACDLDAPVFLESRGAAP